MIKRTSIPRIGREGFLLALSPLPLLFLFVKTNDMGAPPFWQSTVAVAAAVALFLCALTLFRRPRAGKLMGCAAAAGTYGVAFPLIMTSPFFALSGTVVLISMLFMLFDFPLYGHAAQKTIHTDRCLQRAWWGSLAVPLIVVLDVFLGTVPEWGSSYIIALSSFIAQMLFAHWAIEKKAAFYFF